MSKKRTIIFLLLILCLAGFFRLWQLDSAPPGLYPDEAINGNNALEAAQTSHFKWFYPENNGREGLYINLEAIPLYLFGNQPWSLRLLSAVFGILTVLGLYLLAKELFKNERLALFSSFFLAVSFWHIVFSRIGFRAIMAPFFLVWGFYLLYKVINHEKITGYWLLVTGSGLLFGLGFHTYIAYRVAPLLLIIPFIMLWRAKQKRVILTFLLGVFVAGLPLGWYFLNNPQDFLGRTSQISVFSSETPIKDLGINVAKTFGMLFYQGDSNWRHNMSGEAQLFWPVAILFLIGLIIGFKKLRTKGYELLIVWLTAMSLPVIISNEGIPHALRAIILIPPIMIFAGIGLEFIVSKINGWLTLKLQQYPESKKQLLRIKKHFVILLFVFFLLVASRAFIQYFQRWAPNINTYYAFNGRYLEIGNYLNVLPTETKKYIVVNAAGVEVKNIPMPAQTVMFATDTYSEEKQKEKNIFYILPGDTDSISCPKSCAITTLETDTLLREKIKKQIPGLELTIEPGIEALKK